MLRLALPVLVCLSMSPAHGSMQDTDQSVDELMREGSEQIQEEEFDAAAKAFRKVTELDADNPTAWQMLGYSLHVGGKLDEAIKAHAKAASFPQTRGIGLYNLGCAYSLKKDSDKAFGYLNRALKAGFDDDRLMETDTDLDSLRKDVRFTRFMKRVEGETVTDDFQAADIVGRWVVVSETQSGKKNDKVSGFAVVTAREYSLTGEVGAQGPLPYVVDTSKVVPTILVAGSAAGIMRMDGDTLTVCLNPKGSDAPKKFESTKENGLNMLVVRRVLTPADVKGTWEYVSGSRTGEDVAKERLVGEVVVTDATFTLPASATENFVMKYSLDATSALNTIDFEIESGPIPEGKAVGIIKVDGDTITFCYDPTGMKRPEAFKTTADDGYFMFKLKRKAAAAK